MTDSAVLLGTPEAAAEGGATTEEHIDDKAEDKAEDQAEDAKVPQQQEIRPIKYLMFSK